MSLIESLKEKSPDWHPSVPMEIGKFLRIAIDLAARLNELHAKGLVHKDIKPANVLVNATTGNVQLTGFNLASRLPREHQPPEPPEFIAGTLAYMAPEQTGRMNRSIDSRSDLYALGVTLYEMLTGQLPFTASDPMEWVHCHIARHPVPPIERDRDIPPPISAIIMKLLAKTAEERYQTATGVENDLRRCLAQWEAGHCIKAFPLGKKDTPDQLRIPETLYGRERAIGNLLAAFDRVVKDGTPELVLISGYSGIGKSSVVNELHKVLVPPHALFAAGKFHQYKRDIPYTTLAQAFQSLIRMLLSKDETELTDWREAFREVLGPNGQLMVDLVPELALIIGEQPLIAELPPQDAQRRFQLVFRRFLGVFATPEHPLALFLDDLQWLDAATLDLMEDLLTHEDIGHLLLIGAYRENEVGAHHPLTRKLAAIRQNGAKVEQIVLPPLSPDDVEQLVADSLRCETKRSAPLARLIHEKTAGNPFFVIQFLSALAEEGLLRFDHGKGQWSWDIDRIHAKGYTDNVADLVACKLNRLPTSTKKVLQELACLGNVAGSTTLALVHGTAEEEVHEALWEAVRQEFVVRLDGTYKFIHDRVQEAAYSLIPEEHRAKEHLRIGRLLAANTPPENREEAIFEIAGQLNRGAALITAQDEREQLAEFNLIAGKRAKASTAYASALRYLAAGAALLPEDCRERRHELAFQLELNRAECEFLTQDMTSAQDRLEALANRAVTALERAAVACLSVDLFHTLGQGSRAIEVGLDYLRQLGIKCSPHPAREDVLHEYDRIRTQLERRTIEELIDLPLMTDPSSIATMDVLTKIIPPALFSDGNLFSQTVCRAINLSLAHGNSPGSCIAYACLGMIAGPQFGNYEAGFRFGQVGCKLVEQHRFKRFRAGTCMIFGNVVMPWTEHVRSGRYLIRRAFEVANINGDLTYAAYSANNLITNMLCAGDPLNEMQREAENSLAFAQGTKFELVICSVTAQLLLIRTLRGLTEKFGSFDDEQFDEAAIERHYASRPGLGAAEVKYWVRKLQARFFANDYASAIEASFRARRLLDSKPPQLENADYHFYAALSHAASCDSAAIDQRQQHIEALAAHRKQLDIWAGTCPENFENRAALVGAEIAHIEGRELDAERLYETAIQSARDNGFIHNEALANELAARFYAARGFEKIANLYLRDARDGYQRWGAEGKVLQLEDLHPQLLADEPASGPASIIRAPVEHLDLATITKVSQAVSGEIVQEKLIDTLMRIALEHAGAERGLLLLPQDGKLRISAEATIDADKIIVFLQDAPLDPSTLPESIVSYVMRTRNSVILDDATSPTPFAGDVYLREAQPRSVLCLPLVKQGKLIAMLYLENNLAPRVFTTSRMQVLNVLVSGAAISLENSRLYRDLYTQHEKILQLNDTLRQSNEELERFAYICSHDMQEPVRMMSSYAQRLAADYETVLDGQGHEYLKFITSNAARIWKMIQDILIFSRLSGKEIRVETVDCNRIVSEVLAEFETMISEKEARVTCTDLPTLYTCPTLIRILFQNLIGNALKFQDGSKPPEISIEAEPQDRFWRFSVRDNGIGIDPSFADRIFTAFQHLHRQEDYPGIGIGLSTCRKFIRRCGGDIGFESVPGTGTVFFFTVPIQAEPTP